VSLQRRAGKALPPPRWKTCQAQSDWVVEVDSIRPGRRGYGEARPAFVETMARRCPPSPRLRRARPSSVKTTEWYNSTNTNSLELAWGKW